MTTNYYQEIVKLVKEVSGQKNIIGIPKVYIKITNNLSMGAFLSQVVFWSDQSSRADGFFYRSARDWKDELCLSYDQVTRIAKALETQGLIETRLMRAEGAPTMHYRPVMDKIVTLILGKLENRETRKSGNSKIDSQESQKSDSQETLKSITETKNNSETNGAQAPASKDQAQIDELLPSNESELLFFEQLTPEYHAKNRRSPKKFPSLACKRKFNVASERLGETALKSAISRAFEKGIIAVSQVVDFIAKYEQAAPPSSATSAALSKRKLNDEQIALAAKLDQEIKNV